MTPARGGSVDDAATRLDIATRAMLAIGVNQSPVVELCVDGSSSFVTFAVNDWEHSRRQQAGLGAVTSTGLLHALWTLPVGLPVPWAALRNADLKTLHRGSAGHAVDLGLYVMRTFVPAGEVTAVASVNARLADAVHRVSQLPPIYRRIAVSAREQRVPHDVLEMANKIGIGIVVVSAHVTKVMTTPAEKQLGVPAVYRWWISELVYRNWLSRTVPTEGAAPSVS